jgi:hypothetical protein
MRLPPTFLTILAAGTFVPAIGSAAPKPATDAAPNTAPAALHLSFSAYAAGLNVLDMQSTLELNDRSYRVEVDYRTTGVFGVVVHSEMQSIVAGLWEPGGVGPTRFYAYGTLRGVPRRTQIDYRDGQPVVKILEPAASGEREPVPPELEHNTVDTLSAMALLVHEVAETGHCNGHVTTFDGRRVSVISVHDAGEVTLAEDGASAYHGPAHRCDFEGKQVAGFVHDVERAELERPQHGSAWLAPVAPGTMPVPVRISFHTRYFGDATAYLTRVEPAAGAAPGSAGSAVGPDAAGPQKPAR